MPDITDIEMIQEKGVYRRNNAVYFSAECNQENIYKIKEHLMDIYNFRGTMFAALVINSPGGYADSIAFYDWLKAYPLPLVTFIEGICASAATTVFLAGHQRFISPSSQFMAHSARKDYYGYMKEGELRDEHEEIQTMNQIVRKIYTTETKLTKAQLDEFLSYKEKWLTARECIKYGIAHKVGVFMEASV